MLTPVTPEVLADLSIAALLKSDVPTDYDKGFEALDMKYRDEIIRYCWRKFQNAAEDIYQQTIMYVFNTRFSINCEKEGDLRKLMYSAAYHRRQWWIEKQRAPRPASLREPWASIQAEYNGGMPLLDLAKKFNVCIPLIKKFIEGSTAAMLSGTKPPNPDMLTYEIDWKAAKTAFLSGMPRPDICLIYGMTYSSLFPMLRKMGVKNTVFYKWNFDWTPMIQEYQTTGRSIAELAQKYQVSPNFVKSVFRKNGVKHRSKEETIKGVWIKRHQKPNYYLENLPWDIIEEKFGQGLSVRAIAKFFGMAHETLAKYMKMRGMEPPTKSEAQKMRALLSQRARFKDIDWNEYKRKYEQEGYSLSTLAKMAGVSRPMLTVQMKKLGVTLKNVLEGRLDQNARLLKERGIDLIKIASEYESGIGTPELGKKYGVNDRWLRGRLVKMGVQMRTKTEGVLLKNRRDFVERVKKVQWAIEQEEFPVEHAGEVVQYPAQDQSQAAAAS